MYSALRRISLNRGFELFIGVVRQNKNKYRLGRYLFYFLAISQKNTIISVCEREARRTCGRIITPMSLIVNLSKLPRGGGAPSRIHYK